MSKKSGRVHWLTIAAPVGVLVLVGVLAMGGKDPQGRAAVFMSALAKGDAKTLADSSYVEGFSNEQITEKWKQSVDQAKYYRFQYKILGVQQTTNESAQVRMHVWRNAANGGGYEENYQLDLKKVDGDWKVRLNGLSRTMYPFLPRFDK